ncbi:MAG: SGNH/GDSL hydrolase family protein [Gammaproteobacteria bacterium]|nr:SGNH/GDSL hydrolase family protein [Gammaproteobacteria bacterium]
MRNHLASLFALLLMVCAAQAQAYSSMFVFGDSLSDDGNNAVLLPSLLIPQTTAPFTQDFPAPVIAVGTYAGSNNYSNGPVWADYLAGALGLPLGPSLLGGNNYAFGGARTGLIGTADDNDIRPPNLQVQAASAVTDNGGVLPGDALYAVWGGANDIRALGAQYGSGLSSLDPLVVQQSNLGLTNGISASLNNLFQTLSTLAGAGARDFLLLSLPDLGLTPAARFFETPLPGTQALLTGLSSAYNQSLGDLANFVNSAPGYTLTLLDVFALNHAAVDNPAPGANVTEACTSQNAFTGCTDPENFLYWDGVHPTTATHQVIAAAALNALQPAPVPLPASLPLAVGGMVMLLGVARRRRAA